MTKREALVLSAFTGYLLWHDFSDVHKLIEDTMGRPVWSHELGSKAFQAALREKLMPEVRDIIRNIREEVTDDHT